MHDAIASGASLLKKWENHTHPPKSSSNRILGNSGGVSFPVRFVYLKTTGGVFLKFLLNHPLFLLVFGELQKLSSGASQNIYSVWVSVCVRACVRVGHKSLPE